VRVWWHDTSVKRGLTNRPGLRVFGPAAAADPQTAQLEAPRLVIHPFRLKTPFKGMTGVRKRNSAAAHFSWAEVHGSLPLLHLWSKERVSSIVLQKASGYLRWRHLPLPHRSTQEPLGHIGEASADQHVQSPSPGCVSSGVPVVCTF